MTESRSILTLESLQESLDATSSAAKLKRTGNAQFLTPDWFAAAMGRLLPSHYPKTAVDWQCGRRALLNNAKASSTIGIELDRRCKPEGEPDPFDRHITGNCVKVWELLDELWPDLVFGHQVANPPFGIDWPTKPADSTAQTWEQLIRRAGKSGTGYMIANRATIERLALHFEAKVWLYQTFPVGIFPEANVEIGVLHFHAAWKNGIRGVTVAHETADRTQVENRCTRLSIPYQLQNAWGTDRDRLLACFDVVAKILAEEERDRPPFNIWLDHRGHIKTYLSTRETLARKLTAKDLERLKSITGSHPLALTPEKATRDLMAEFIRGGTFTIDPKAKAAIEEALESVKTLAIPIMPVTDFQRVAYCDEEEALEAIADTNPKDTEGISLFGGSTYPLTTATYSFKNQFKRLKLHGSDEGSYTRQHDMTLSGSDRFIEITDDHDRRHQFLDRPDPAQAWGAKNHRGPVFHHHDSLLWKLFKKPEVPTVAEKFPEKVAHNLAMMEACEAMAGFDYFPGQRSYLSRVATKDYAMVAAATGVGKSLMAISLIQIKAPHRALIVAPQGTTRASKDDTDSAGALTASQWISEIRRFAPGLPVFELFSAADYARILNANGDTLPAGVFVTYYEAMFSNGARETDSETFTDRKACAEVGIKPNTPNGREFTENIGCEKNGIRCVWRPCLATLIGHMFDMVCYDESHKCQHLSSGITNAMIRMQPKYRYAYSATPIPNLVSDVFPIMGWLCVPGWFKGKMRNAAWPYAREEGSRFCSTFLSTERDLTQEDMNRKAAQKKGEKYKGKCEKVSPIVSAPARLLKILTPTLAYISKEDCRADLPPRHLHDVRVPMGKQQARLYAHYMERGNVPGKTALERASKQVNILRACTADPAGTEWNCLSEKVKSSFNPKTAAILALVGQMRARGEQAVIVCSRLGQSDVLQRKLHEAGVVTARIDSSLPPEGHTGEAHRFKKGEARVLLMGIKCAQAHSFPQCPNLIIGSLEYSCGTFEQAVGRVWRVNSPIPVHVWCVLHQGTIEEIMFDTVATKGDAAAICLRGQRVPRDHKPVDLGEVLAINFEQLAKMDLKQLQDEGDIEAGWPALRAELRNNAA